MKNVNPFEICVVSFIDELGIAFRENVWLSDVPKFVRECVKTIDECPMESIKIEFGLEPLKDSTGFYRECWSGFVK